jgi:hypothetical protein
MAFGACITTAVLVLSVMTMTVTLYYAWAEASPGKFLPGGVKNWRSTHFNTRKEAEDCLEAYIHGHEVKVKESGIGSSLAVRVIIGEE